MLKQFVIAKDADGFPLKRILTGVRGRTMYLASPEAIGAVECGDSEPILFLLECCYLFDDEVFSELLRDIEQHGSASSPMWSRLTPYRDVSHGTA